jgi:hypothetical protein
MAFRRFLRRDEPVSIVTSSAKEPPHADSQIAPLMESVPPRLYGGTERVVSHLCEALVQEGMM